MIKKLTLKNGIIQDKELDGIPIRIDITEPKGLRNARTLIPMTKVIGITNHNTANSSKWADDVAHGKYVQTVENADKMWVSFHFAVDEDSITQIIPLNEVAYHAGDGKGNGNYHTISIEICENGNHAKTELNAQKLNVALLKTYGNIKIYKHQDWSGKYCPHRILSRPDGWKNYVDGIYRMLNEPTGGNKLEKTFIMGKSKLTAEQLKTYLLTKNKKPKLQGISVLEFCKLWIEEGEKEGVKGDIAFAQACHETGFFKYGSLVLPEQNNYGGIGAVNGSKVGKGAWFDSPRLGVRANIQHLKAYASKENLVNECIDPRFHLVTRGIAPHFEDLGGKWAVPGFSKKKYNSLSEALANKASYGDFIIKIYSKICKVKPKKKKSAWQQEVESAVKWAKANEISDCTRLDDTVTRRELIVMLYRMSK